MLSISMPVHSHPSLLAFLWRVTASMQIAVSASASRMQSV